MRWFFEVGNHEATPERERWIRALACRAVAFATGERPGPVHLNWGLREPLVPPRRRPRRRALARAPRRAAVARSHAAGGPARSDLARRSSAAPRRGVIVAGRDDAGLAPAIPALAADCGYPLLADPLSGARRGARGARPLRPAAARPGVRRRARARGRDPRRRPPDLEGPARLARGAAAAPARSSSTRSGAWQDPDSVVDTVICGRPAGARRPGGGRPRLARGLARGRRARRRRDRRDARRASSASRTSRARSRAAPPAGSTVFVAASMAVRQLEWFWPVGDGAPRVLSNRGANGIDGTLATAFGVAAATAGPVFVAASATSRSRTTSARS